MHKPRIGGRLSGALAIGVGRLDKEEAFGHIFIVLQEHHQRNVECRLHCAIQKAIVS